MALPYNARTVPLPDTVGYQIKRQKSAMDYLYWSCIHRPPKYFNLLPLFLITIMNLMVRPYFRRHQILGS